MKCSFCVVIWFEYVVIQISQVVLVVENPSANIGRLKRRRFDSWVGKISGRRAWKPTPVFLPREPHGQRSLVGYSPWGPKESGMTKRPYLLTYIGRKI